MQSTVFVVAVFLRTNNSRFSIDDPVPNIVPVEVDVVKLVQVEAGLEGGLDIAISSSTTAGDKTF